MDLHLFYVEHLEVYFPKALVCSIIVPYLNLNYFSYKSEVIDELKHKFRGHFGSGVQLDTCEMLVFRPTKGIKYWIQTRIRYRGFTYYMSEHLRRFYTFRVN